MSDINEENGEEGRWLEVIEYDYGPRYYGDIFYDNVEDANEDKEKLPDVDYNDIAYSHWTMKMSFKAIGLDERYWNKLLLRSQGPQLYVRSGGIKSYHTLLYKMHLCPKKHAEFTDMLLYLYSGYLRSIWKRYNIQMICTDVVIKHITFEGSWYIEAPFFKYKLIELDSNGYFLNPYGNESTEDEEEDESMY